MGGKQNSAASAPAVAAAVALVLVLVCVALVQTRAEVASEPPPVRFALRKFYHVPEQYGDRPPAGPNVRRRVSEQPPGPKVASIGLGLPPVKGWT